jgi:hypothetical protein
MHSYLAWKNILICGAILCGLGICTMMAQPRRTGGPPPQRDPLEMLNHALAKAGAPALNPQQEQQLTQLIETMRAQRQQPNATLLAAQRAFDNAVFASNLAAANAQADIIAQQISADANQHLHAAAKFKIEALSILKSNASQLGTLTQRFGTAGVSHMLDTLSGGPDRPGMNPRPDGPPPPL